MKVINLVDLPEPVKEWLVDTLIRDPERSFLLVGPDGRVIGSMFDQNLTDVFLLRRFIDRLDAEE